MQARGPLMIEHRLIERMIALIEKELARIEETNQVNPAFIDVAVDFIRIYADRTHHGKEEDILFRDLAQKELSEEDQALMEELVQEHVYGREVTADLVAANARYRDGDASAVAVVKEKLATLAEFYPQHIEKEDKVFFPASLAYLSAGEQQAMLDEFWAFDAKMIHEKYRGVVKTLEP